MPVCVMDTCVCILGCVIGNMCMLACECEVGAYLRMPLCVLCAYVCTHVCVLVG